MIALSESELELVKAIVLRHVPFCKVIVFGSRIKGTHTPASDLDIALISDDEKILPVWEIKEDFMESDIPFRVDVLDYHRVSNNFRKIIDHNNETFFDTRPIVSD